MKRRPTLCYYSRAGRDAGYWLGAAVVFGGLPVAVYFTTEDAKILNLVVGALLGLPCLAASWWCLGKTTFLAIHKDEKLLVFGKSIYHRREAESVEFSLIERVEWRIHGTRHAQWSEIQVWLRDGRRLILPQHGGRLLKLRAQKIAAIVGVPVEQGADAPRR